MMVSCSDGHDEIHFEGHFSALCPLCKMRAELMEEAETARSEAADAIRSADEEVDGLADERDEATEKLDKMEEAIAKIVYAKEESEIKAAIEAASILID